MHASCLCWSGIVDGHGIATAGSTLPLSVTWPWLHGISALLAGAAFASMAVLLLSIARQQRESSTHRLLWLLGIGLAACGGVQLVRLIDAWSPLSGPAGALMLMFAAG